MNVSKVIKRLEKLQKERGDIRVIIDMDENGWHNVEKINLETDEDDELYINIQSSNEA